MYGGRNIAARGFAAFDPHNAATDVCYGFVRRTSNNSLTEEVTDDLPG